MKAGVHTVMEEGEAANRRKRTGVVTGAGPQAQFALQVRSHVLAHK
jgi:threonine dehydrogenase-like Zn-dependent dehydrogenase